MKEQIKTIGLVTSGGDAPGMNAAIRAVVRTALNHKLRVMAIHNGYEGLMEGKLSELHASSVSNILHLGGTIIKTSRSENFKTHSGRKRAYGQLKKAGIDALLVIGGNGSLAGASAFASEFPVPVIGIPKTIDNDIYGTDIAIGFDTAVNTAIQAIDRIRDTANSHHRLFLVEVMGNHSGCIALHSGLAGGAEVILVPEKNNGIGTLVTALNKGWQRHKSSLIVVVAEGALEGGVKELQKHLESTFKNYEIRSTVLGYIQRGGSPSYADRLLAARLGHEAVKALLAGRHNVMTGLVNGHLVLVPLSELSKQKPEWQEELLKLAEELSL
ncbi:MAG: 6-phosphofructokinase [Bacteroidia bacterium]